MGRRNGDDRDEVNRLLAALSHDWRRYALYCLHRHSTVTLPDLADEVAVWDADRPIGEIPAEEVKDVYMSLYHSHVPKLEEADLVTYDQEGDLVSITDRGLEVGSSLGDLADRFSEETP